MGTLAGVLLAMVLVATLVGFRTGPHHHAAVGALGAVAAGFLLVLAAARQSAPVVFALLGAVLAVSAGVGVAAWKGLQSVSRVPRLEHHRLEGAIGVATSALEPEGVVRVRGEAWSATSLNGKLPVGAAVQVIRAGGVRLEVWGEDLVPPRPRPLVIDDLVSLEGGSDRGRSGQRRAGS